jgi:hypothetical protein
MSIIIIEFARVRSDWDKRMNDGVLTFWGTDTNIFCNKDGEILENNVRNSISVYKDIDGNIGVQTYDASSGNNRNEVFVGDSCHAQAKRFMLSLFEQALGKGHAPAADDLATLCVFSDDTDDVENYMDDCDAEWLWDEADQVVPETNPCGSLFVEIEFYNLEIPPIGKNFELDTDAIASAKEQGDFWHRVGVGS